MRRAMVGVAVAVLAVACCSVAAGGSVSRSSNGEAAKDPEAIVTDAVQALKRSTVVSISGTFIKDGKRTSIDIISAHGSGGGTITTQGATFEIIVTPPKVYIMADARTWSKISGNASAGALLAGKWLQTTTADKDFASFVRLLDVSQWAKTLSKPGEVTKGKVTTFKGQKAVPLYDNSSDRGVLYVADRGRRIRSASVASLGTWSSPITTRLRRQLHRLARST